jgi:hypothetical protein
MRRKYEAVEAPTNTEEAIEASKAFWLKRFAEASLAVAIAKVRCDQLGVDTSEAEVHPDQLRLDTL